MSEGESLRMVMSILLCLPHLIVGAVIITGSRSQ